MLALRPNNFPTRGARLLCVSVLLALMALSIKVALEGLVTTSVVAAERPIALMTVALSIMTLQCLVGGVGCAARLALIRLRSCDWLLDTGSCFVALRVTPSFFLVPACPLSHLLLPDREQKWEKRRERVRVWEGCTEAIGRRETLDLHAFYILLQTYRAWVMVPPCFVKQYFVRLAHDDLTKKADDRRDGPSFGLWRYRQAVLLNR